MSRLGADPEQLDQLATSLDREAGQLTSSLGATSAAMSNTWWMGPDADRLRTWWRSTAAPDVRGLADRLTELAGSVRRQAAEQRRASANGGGGSGAGGGGGGGGGSRQPTVGFPVGPFGPSGTPFPITPAVTLGLVDGLRDIFDGEEDDDDGQSSGFGIPGPFDDWVRDGGEAIVDRGTTLVDYGVRTLDRRLEHPVQTLVDIATGTAIAEDVTAGLQIGIGDAEIVDTRYGNDAVFLTEAWAPFDGGAITIGHTVSVNSDSPPSDDLVRHEMQHVYDIEDAGGAGFYTSYGADYAWNRLVEGRSHDDAYRDIFWEQRGYHTGDHGSEPEPEGIFGGIWKDIWTTR